jgi:hypothetical protein
MNDSGFCSIVPGLKLRDIDDMTAHTRSSNEATFPECWLQLLAIDGSLLELLAPPMYTCHASTVECAIKVCGDYFVVMVKLPIKCWPLCPRNARIGYEDVQAPIEFADYGFDTSSNGFEGSHVDLVRFT